MIYRSIRLMQKRVDIILLFITMGMETILIVRMFRVKNGITYHLAKKDIMYLINKMAVIKNEKDKKIYYNNIGNNNFMFM